MRHSLLNLFFQTNAFLLQTIFKKIPLASHRSFHSKLSITKDFSFLIENNKAARQRKNSMSILQLFFIRGLIFVYSLTLWLRLIIFHTEGSDQERWTKKIYQMLPQVDSELLRCSLFSWNSARLDFQCTLRMLFIGWSSVSSRKILIATWNKIVSLGIRWCWHVSSTQYKAFHVLRYSQGFENLRFNVTVATIRTGRGFTLVLYEAT